MVMSLKHEFLGNKLMDSSTFSLKVEVGLFIKVLHTISPSFKLWEPTGVEAKVLGLLLPPCLGWGKDGFLDVMVPEA